MLRSHFFIAAAVLGVFAGTSRATLVNITVTGPVDFNVIGGAMAPVPDAPPVSMSFNVDSNNFINSPNFPTRGYPLDLSSFNMTVGGVPVPMIIPQPGGETPMFILRDNDPAVDGFFLSNDNVDFPFPVYVNIPGLVPDHELDFSVSFDNGNVISSLNILDAVGSYTQAGLAVYNWGIGRFGNHGAEYVYTTMTISVVPEPATIGLPLIAGVAVLARRRSRASA